MTVDDLVRTIGDLVTEVLADLRLLPPDGSPARPPAVVLGWAPPPRDAEEQQPPLVVIRATEGSDEAGESTATVRLLVETWAEDASGWRDASNVTQRLRTALTGRRTIGPYHMILPLTWRMADDQALPFWVSEITTTWAQPRAAWLGETE